MNYNFTRTVTKIKNILLSLIPADSLTFMANITASNVIKKYLIEFLCIILFVIPILLFTVDKPVVNYRMETGEIELPQTGEKENIVQEVYYDGAGYKNIESRNIFSQDGSYGSVSSYATKKKIPDRPYDLIGVFVSEQKKAVLKEYTGKMITSKIGDKLDGGFVVTGIDDISVKLEKNNKEMELKIFKLEEALDKNKAD